MNQDERIARPAFLVMHAHAANFREATRGSMRHGGAKLFEVEIDGARVPEDREGYRRQNEEQCGETQDFFHGRSNFDGGKRRIKTLVS